MFRMRMTLINDSLLMNKVLCLVLIFSFIVDIERIASYNFIKKGNFGIY